MCDNVRIIFESVMMPFTQNRRSQTALVEITACQIWLFFETQCRMSDVLSIMDTANSVCFIGGLA